MFRDLRTQILLWTILPLAVILSGVAYYGVSSHQAEMRSLVEERDGALARVAAARVSEALAGRIAILQALDPARPETWQAQRTAFDGGIALFDSQGNLLNAIPAADAWPARRAAVQAMIAARSNFSAPLLEQGAPRVIVLAYDGDRILAGAFALPPLLNVGMGSSGIAYLVDPTGTIIVHPDPSENGQSLSQHPGISEVMRGESGATFHRSATGAELVVGYAPIAPTGWGLIVEEPWEQVVTPMFQYSVLLPLVLLIAAIGALGAIYFGVRHVVRPLQMLAQAANRIGQGDYTAARQPVGGVREVEELRERLDRMAGQVDAAQVAMQNYIKTIMRGQEDERMRLARELHDDTIQSLIALQQRIEMTQKALAKDPALAAGRLDELKNLLTETLTSVRRFVRDLRPSYLENLGLIPALEMLTREAKAELVVQGEEVRLDAERELALYRIIQEALRNATKHARASRVAVTVSFTADQATATVQDNGLGFDVPPAGAAFARAGHFGLMGMQERAQLFGGNVYVESTRGKGTLVRVCVPIRN